MKGSVVRPPVPCLTKGKEKERTLSSNSQPIVNQENADLSSIGKKEKEESKGDGVEYNFPFAQSALDRIKRLDRKSVV